VYIIQLRVTCVFNERNRGLPIGQLSDYGYLAFFLKSGFLASLVCRDIILDVIIKR